MYIILNVLAIERNPPIGIPERPAPPAGLYSPFLHLGFAILRLLVLLTLYPALANPYKTFILSATLATHRAQPAAEEGNGGVSAPAIAIPSETSFHASSGLPKPLYGTFTLGNGSQPSQHTSSRVPSPSPDGQSTPRAAGISGHATPIKKSKHPGHGWSSGAGAAEVSPDPTWHEVGQRVRRLLPHLWPRGSLKLEALALFCFCLLIIARFVAFLMPVTLRELVALFDRVQTGQAQSPWKLLFIYVGLRFLQGSGGLGALRDVISSCASDVFDV
jgi:ATP-binding cassette subfamily B (MDR/TAP) protein 6